MSLLKKLGVTLLGITATSGTPAFQAVAQEPLKMGIVTFLSGPAAGPFGVPARNGAELMADAINHGTLPAPYNKKGAGGRSIALQFVDESGGNAKQVQEFRNMAQSNGIRVVVGYISSGSCNAIAPVADELKVLTVYPVCGAASLFEDSDWKYSFRTITHVASDNVAAALYIRDVFPQIRTFTGINQNYAFGQESWAAFTAAMGAVNPQMKSDGKEAWPKLFSGQYASEISSILLRDVDLVHSSFWDGDLEALLLQGKARDLFSKRKFLLTIGATASYRLGNQLPDGLIVGAHGPYGVLVEHRDTPLNKWFVKAYRERYGADPLESAYHYAQAVLAVKNAFDMAVASGNQATVESAVKAFAGMTFESITTTIRMALSKGHQAVHENGYGLTKWDGATGRPTVTDVKFYPPECVMPPEGIKTMDWIKGGMKGSSCLK